MTSENSQTEHRQGSRMLWLVVAIPALTVVGCLLTIYLALSSPDEIVSDYSLRIDTGLEPRSGE